MQHTMAICAQGLQVLWGYSSPTPQRGKRLVVVHLDEVSTNLPIEPLKVKPASDAPETAESLAPEFLGSSAKEGATFNAHVPPDPPPALQELFCRINISTYDAVRAEIPPAQLGEPTGDGEINALNHAPSYREASAKAVSSRGRDASPVGIKRSGPPAGKPFHLVCELALCFVDEGAATGDLQ